MIWKISLQHIGIGNEHLYHSLCKSLHVTLPDLFILKKMYFEKVSNLFCFLISFSFHFCFGWQKLRKMKILRICLFVCLFVIFHFRLACLAFQMENIVQKITQPIFVFGNFVNENEKWKMGWKAHKSNPKRTRGGKCPLSCQLGLIKSSSSCTYFATIQPLNPQSFL